MIFFSLKGEKYSGRVCRDWSSANIYVNVLYRVFKNRWKRGMYGEEVELFSDFLAEFYHVLFHESLHILMRKLHGKLYSSERKIDFAAAKIMDKFIDCLIEDGDRFFWRFWAELLPDIFAGNCGGGLSDE